jgi:CBS domain-containing protein
MKTHSNVAAPVRLMLCADTAAELMSPNPVSIEADATVREAVGFMVDKGFSAAPVIDKAGRPVGVVSQSDIVVHDRESVEYAQSTPGFYQRSDQESCRTKGLKEGFGVVEVDRTRVSAIMTPVVLSVSATTRASKVVEEMLKLKVHRLFVVDEAGVLIGVISALDILRHLHPE